MHIIVLNTLHEAAAVLENGKDVLKMVEVGSCHVTDARTCWKILQIIYNRKAPFKAVQMIPLNVIT